MTSDQLRRDPPCKNVRDVKREANVRFIRLFIHAVILTSSGGSTQVPSAGTRQQTTPQFERYATKRGSRPLIRAGPGSGLTTKPDQRHVGFATRSSGMCWIQLTTFDSRAPARP